MSRTIFSAAGHSPTDPHRAEVLASSFSVPRTKAQLLSLLDVLPPENPARGRPGDFSFTTGAWSKDGQYGLRKHSTMFPTVTAALTAYVCSQDSHHTFSAVALFADLQTQPHRDVNNDPAVPNMLLALTSFSGGQVWQHEDQGAASSRPPLGSYVWAVFSSVASPALHFTLAGSQSASCGVHPLVQGPGLRLFPACSSGVSFAPGPASVSTPACGAPWSSPSTTSHSSSCSFLRLRGVRSTCSRSFVWQRPPFGGLA